MNMLVQAIKNGLMTRTENGAITHASSLSNVLDFYAQGGGCRLGGRSALPLFEGAYAEHVNLALKALFYMRDVRQGQGERDLFRESMEWLKQNDYDVFIKLIPHVAEYGRWDDILTFVDSPDVVQAVKEQLMQDLSTDHPSLLAKWMPSENTSSKATRSLARKWIVALGLSAREYRKGLSKLRSRIDIVERHMSAKEFDAIQYERVPSRAMKKYRASFGKQDEERFAEYLKAVETGTKKINSSTLYPYELFKAIIGSGEDKTLELQWKALPDYLDDKNVLVMADVSGSMSGDPIAVSVSLALYAAERSKGAFKNLFMTFSAKPKLVEIEGNTTREKILNICRAQWHMNTNIQAAFDLILNKAVRYKVPADDMPSMIFIISDMQFDIADGKKTNFEVIDKKYKSAGYQRPVLVFWNVRSSSDQTPVTMREDGTLLVSGLSPIIFKYALQGKMLSPYDAMLEVLNKDRYKFINEITGGVDK